MSNQFVIDVLKTAYLKNGQKPIVYSPVSLGSALSMLHLGAAGDTKQQLTKAINEASNGDEISAHYGSVIAAFSDDDNVSVNLATKIVTSKDFDIKEGYQADCEKLFKSCVDSLDFSDGEAGAAHVNGFVSETTHGKIDEIVKADEFKDAVAFLINAVYFKAAWDTELRELDTQPFKGYDGEREEMYIGKNDIVGKWSESDGDQMITLPFVNSDYEFFALLPQLGWSICDAVTSMSGVHLDLLFGALQQQPITVRFPRIKESTPVNGRAVLEALGVTDLFGEKADLSHIADGPLQVSSVTHKAVIDVNEFGCEAAAATSIAMCLKSLCMPLEPSKEIVFDRPFVYGIRRCDEILFAGIYQ